MKIFIEKGRSEKNISFSGSALQLLKKLNIMSEDVIIARDNEIITLDTKLSNDDEVKILSVISGG